MGKLVSDHCRQQLAGGIKQSDWSVCLRDGIVGLARFAQDDSGEFAPWLKVCMVGDGGIEEMKEVGGEGISAFLEYNITSMLLI